MSQSGSQHRLGARYAVCLAEVILDIGFFLESTSVDDSAITYSAYYNALCLMGDLC